MKWFLHHQFVEELGAVSDFLINTVQGEFVANVTIVYNSSEADANKFSSTFDSFVIPPNTLPTAANYFNQILSSFAYTNDSTSYSILNNYISDNLTPTKWDIFTSYYGVGYSGSLSASGSNIKTISSVHLASGDTLMLSGNLNYPGLPIFTSPYDGSTITSFGALTKNSAVAPGNDLYVFFDGTLVKSGNNYTGFFDKYTESIDLPNGIRMDITLGLQNNAFLSIGSATTASITNVRVNYVNFKAFTESGINEINISYDTAVSGDKINFTPESYLSGNDIIATSGNGPVYSYGFSGDDAIFANGQRDIIDGGVGADMVVFSGKRSSYITGKDGEFFTITDSINPLNIDKVKDVEIIKFSDQQITIANLFNDNSVKNIGAIYSGAGLSIYKINTGKYVIADSGIEMGQNIVDYLTLMASATKAYIPKGIVSVFDYADGTFGVVSKIGKNFSEQVFSINGIMQGKPLKLTATQLLAKEVIAGQDINGDGVIGEVVAAVLDGDGDATQQFNGLYKTLAGAVVIGAAGLEVSNLVGESITLMASSKKGWVIPKGATVEGIAFTDGGSLEVLTSKGSAVSAQKFDELTGLMIGKAVKLTNVQLESREYYYDLDLNGDNIISLIGQELPPTGWQI